MKGRTKSAWLALPSASALRVSRFFATDSRRLKTDKNIIADLPDKTEVKAFCHLTRKQAALYQTAVAELDENLKQSGDGIARRGLVLSSLMRLKQICNHPSQWLGDGTYRSSRLECSGRRASLRRLRCRKAASWSVVRRCAPCAGDLQPGQDRSRMKPCSNSVSAPNMWKTRRFNRLGQALERHAIFA